MSDKNTRRQALIEQYEKAWAAQERRDFALTNRSGIVIPISRWRVIVDWLMSATILGLVSSHLWDWWMGQGEAQKNLFMQAWWILAIVLVLGSIVLVSTFKHTRLYLRRQKAYRAWQAELARVLGELERDKT